MLRCFLQINCLKFISSSNNKVLHKLSKCKTNLYRYLPFTRYDHDSGHDSGSEDACYELSQPFTLVTLGMGKLIIPKASSSSSSSTANAQSADPGSRILPMPQRLGVCLDYDACRVYFYDADTMRCLYERQVDCSGTMYPAFGLMGSGKVQLEEFLASKRLAF